MYFSRLQILAQIATFHMDTQWYERFFFRMSKTKSVKKSSHEIFSIQHHRQNWKLYKSTTARRKGTNKNNHLMLGHFSLCVSSITVFSICVSTTLGRWWWWWCLINWCRSMLHCIQLNLVDIVMCFLFVSLCVDISSCSEIEFVSEFFFLLLKSLL